MIGLGMAMTMAGGGIAEEFETCLICLEPSEFVREYELMGGKPVCSSCAAIVANVWHMRHGGTYITWPNEKRERAGYQKKGIPDHLRWQVFDRDGFRCLNCGSRSRLRADHVFPESAGGEATLENLQTLCHNCNSKKGKRLP